MRVLIGAVMALAIGIGAVSAEIKIVDGDTFDLGETRYRLNGIDAPEVGQSCLDARGQAWRCGRAAMDALYDLTIGKKIACSVVEADQYERAIAICTANGLDLGEAMVRQGYAWAFTTYSDRYVDVEKAARLTESGIWQGKAEPPWVYRAARWEVAAQQAPDGCPIKGNISPGGKIYHAPWSPWYARTRISPEKGERWFCDEAEALDAGWRAPYWK